MLPLSLKQTYNEIPASVKQFAKRALILLGAWLLMYHTVLKPHRIPDKWLTDETAKVTTFFLNSWYATGFSTQERPHLAANGDNTPWAVIMLDGKQTLGIADACNALELYVLYIGFIFCIPTGAKRTAIFALAGVAIIFFLNITRLYALTWLSLTHPSFFDFAHHYAFTFIVYGCIFGMWVLYSKKYSPKNEA